MPSIQVVKQSHTPTLLALDGVVGVAIGETDGTPCIRVFLEREDAALREKIPTTLEGHPVEAVVTGSFRAGG